jgi:hypothetical protein
MNKVYIILFVPQIGEKYEMFLPISKKIGVISKLLTKSINELSDGSFPIKDSLLYDRESGIMYDLNITVKESNIRNGSEIILI